MTIQTYSVTTVTGNAYQSSGNTAITSLTMCNWGAANVTANLYVVPNGSSASNNNIALQSVSIPASETAQLYMFAEKLLLANADTIQINASANTVTAITSYTAI
jgi:hypothetical protein